MKYNNITIDFYILYRMAYLPPCRRKDEKNLFKVRDRTKSSTPPPQERPDINAEELFPTLGNKTSKEAEGSKMNFASSLFVPQPKEEVVKPVKDGWVHISRENGETKFEFGECSDNYCELMDFVEDLDEIKRQNVLNKILDRYADYEEIDLFRFGPNYLHSWEVNDYLEEQERERKRLIREQNTSSDESSDDEYVVN